MVNIGDKPIIWHIMKIYSFYGVHDFIVCLGYKGDSIINYFKTQLQTISFQRNVSKSKVNTKIVYMDEEIEWNINLVDTGIDTLTAKRLYEVREFIDPDINLVTYGDGLANINIAELIKFHKKHKKPATVSVTKPVGRFGVISTDSQDLVTHFNEKPRSTEWVNCGFFVFDAEIFNYFNQNEYLEHAPMSKLTDEKKIVAFKHEEFWAVMDTYREYLKLNEIWDSGSAPWKVW